MIIIWWHFYKGDFNHQTWKLAWMLLICNWIKISKAQWVNSLRPSDAYMCWQPRPSLVQIMACRLVGVKPLSEPMLVGMLSIGSLGTNFDGILIELQTFSFKKMHLKISFAKRRTYCLGLNECIWGCLWQAPTQNDAIQGTLLLTWFNFIPSTDK